MFCKPANFHQLRPYLILLPNHPVFSVHFARVFLDNFLHTRLLLAHFPFNYFFLRRIGIEPFFNSVFLAMFCPFAISSTGNYDPPSYYPYCISPHFLNSYSRQSRPLSHCQLYLRFCLHFICLCFLYTLFLHWCVSSIRSNISYVSVNKIFGLSYMTYKNQ